jgi:hypothetical protein
VLGLAVSARKDFICRVRGTSCKRKGDDDCGFQWNAPSKQWRISWPKIWWVDVFPVTITHSCASKDHPAHAGMTGWNPICLGNSRLHSAVGFSDTTQVMFILVWTGRGSNAASLGMWTVALHPLRMTIAPIKAMMANHRFKVLSVMSAPFDGAEAPVD